MNINNFFSKAILLLDDKLKKENNGLFNYDVTYSIINNNCLKIKLKNYYEKMFFIATLKDNAIIIN